MRKGYICCESHLHIVILKPDVIATWNSFSSGCTIVDAGCTHNFDYRTAGNQFNFSDEHERAECALVLIKPWCTIQHPEFAISAFKFRTQYIGIGNVILPA